MDIASEKTEVLIIGSGGAGLRAAIELADKHIDVTIVGKCKKRDAHTILATGGINAALGNTDPKDSIASHVADTIKEGCFINDTKAVEVLCKDAPAAIKELDEWGVKFAKDKTGKIIQRFFGAATYRRACFVGDYTGKAILDALVDQVEKRKVKWKSEVYITALLQKNGKVNGAIGFDKKSGKAIIVQAKIVVLATGGHSRMFSRSSSRFWENNGDGIYLAYEAGAEFMDMEMFQFHPTGMLYPPEADGILVTEAVRGEGGILLNAKHQRFMKNYDPERMELSARDIVARAIYTEVEKGNGTKHGGVWLDIAHISKQQILERLPTMYRQFLKYANIDITKEKMEVGPTAHYSMGGIRTDHASGKTSVKNLFAIGEVTAGVHGANRLGGNSLAEIIVFGKRTGQTIVREVRKIKWLELDQKHIEEKIAELGDMIKKKGNNPVAIKKEIQALMWKHAGVVRNEKDLRIAYRELQKYKRISLKVPSSLKMNEKLIAALDVRNMIPTCEMILKSALERKESRGAHYRSDYPKTDQRWKKNIVCMPAKKGYVLTTKPITTLSPAIMRLLKLPKAKARLLE